MTEITIKKNLAGEEDLLFGEGSVNQSRGGGNFTIHGIRGFWPVNNQTELDELDPVKHPKAVLLDGTTLKFYSYTAGSWVQVKPEGTGTGGATNTWFKSIVFLRQATKPPKPTDGSFNIPVPAGWYDGIPAGNLTLWSTTRIFSSDGLDPQEAIWSDVAQMTSTSTLELQWSSTVLNPGNPETSPLNWSATASTTTVWRAERVITNGSPGAWVVVKIRGENGTNGDDGSSGPRGPGRYYSPTLPAPYTWVDNNPAADAAADAAILAISGTAKVEGDVLTLSKPGDETINVTKIWLAGSWQSFAMRIPGNLLVEGTVVADSVRAGSIFGVNAYFQGTVYAENIVGDTAAGAAKLSTVSFLNNHNVEQSVIEFTMAAVTYDRLVVFPVVHFVTGSSSSGDTWQDIKAEGAITARYYKNAAQIFQDSTIYGVGSYCSKPYSTLLPAGQTAVFKLGMTWVGSDPATPNTAPVVVTQALVVQAFRTSSQIVIS